MALTALDVSAVKKDFPILDVEVHGRRLVYLDSAASSQKPQAVLDAMDEMYETTYANVHRGVYAIAEESTARMEAARAKVARFIGAAAPREVIFGKNVTEMINLVAYTWARQNLREGDAILLTLMEHHANVVPWLMLAEERGIELRWLDFDDDYQLDLTGLEAKLDGVKLVGLAALSNVLGTINPVRTIADAAHAAGALVLVDAAQYVPHNATDVTALGADFLGFTGHKLLGPSGVGCLWARAELLEAMPPFLGGGEMISDVRIDGFETTEIPWKFEAGTPPIVEIVGLGAAIDYLEAIGMDNVRAHEKSLTEYALRALKDRHGDGITIQGPADPADRGGVISFTFRGIHPHDVSQVLDERGVCVRASHHCAKPLMRRLGVGATCRASVYVYNDEADIDALADALAYTGEFFLGK